MLKTVGKWISKISAATLIGAGAALITLGVIELDRVEPTRSPDPISYIITYQDSHSTESRLRDMHNELTVYRICHVSGSQEWPCVNRNDVGPALPIAN